ncbi:MAG: hypothetical protein ACRYG8_00260, partial [Janthinobacterium lividum]
AVGPRAPLPVVVRPNERWSPDFVHDQLMGGRRLRIPTQSSRRFRSIPAGDFDGSQPLIPTHSSHP